MSSYSPHWVRVKYAFSTLWIFHESVMEICLRGVWILRRTQNNVMVRGSAMFDALTMTLCMYDGRIINPCRESLLCRLYADVLCVGMLYRFCIAYICGMCLKFADCFFFFLVIYHTYLHNQPLTELSRCQSKYYSIPIERDECFFF